MYLDQHRNPKTKALDPIVTTAIGNALLTVGAAQMLPWQRPDGTHATPDEIAVAYALVRARRDLAPHGGGAFAKVTTLRLSEDAIDALVASKLAEIEHELLPHFPHLLRAPADAQLVVCSMSWAMGVAKLVAEFPIFCGAIRAEDYRVAAAECHMQEGGQPRAFRLRNIADEMLLRAAANVIDGDLPRDTLTGFLGPYHEDTGGPNV
jgi:hypothetical protein